MGCKVAVVILHYESLDDTKECLDSLIQYGKDNVHIIAVDNGSVVGKLINIEKEYKYNENITFIHSEENLGFARGNNLGYKYAKYNLNPKVIILANNDLIFKQQDFMKVLLKKETDLGFDVAGPKIISLVDGKNQNPVSVVYKTSKEVDRRIRKFRILNILSYFNMDIKMKSLFAKEIEEYHPSEKDDFQLHGACMFFANKFIEKYDGLYDGTFMYGEEFILKQIVDDNGLKMLYLDDLEVFHKEGASTQKIWGKGIKQRQFFYKWSINSLRQLSKMMKIRNL